MWKLDEHCTVCGGRFPTVMLVLYHIELVFCVVHDQCFLWVLDEFSAWCLFEFSVWVSDMNPYEGIIVVQ